MHLKKPCGSNSAAMGSTSFWITFGGQAPSGLLRPGQRRESRGTHPVRTDRFHERAEYYASQFGPTLFRDQLTGSGLGSIPIASLVKSIDELMQAVLPGGFEIATQTFPLSELERVWTMANTTSRVVFQIP